MRDALLLGVLSLFLLILPWWIPACTPLLLVALLPLLAAERRLASPALPQVITWMLVCALVAGGWVVLSLLAEGRWENSSLWLILLLWAALVSFHFIKQYLGDQRGYIALPFLWISALALPWYQEWSTAIPSLGGLVSIEYSHFSWLSTIGVLGTSAWLWLINILLYLILEAFLRHRQWRPLTGQILLLLGLLIALPLGWASGGSAAIGAQPKGILGPHPLPADQFVSRMSFFLAGFLILFTLVKGYLQHRDPLNTSS